MKEIILIIAATSLSLLSGCASTPVIPELQKTAAYTSNFDTVWKAILQVLYEKNLPVTSLKKDKGFISTNPVSLGSIRSFTQNRKEFNQLAVKPESLFYVWDSARFYLNIFARENEEKTIDVTVNVHIEAYESRWSERWYICFSRGRIESSILNSIAAKIDGIDTENNLLSHRDGTDT